MEDLNDEIIERAVNEGEAMDDDDLFGFVERLHDDGHPGVDENALAAYVERLDDRRDFAFDVDGFLAYVDECRTDREAWVGPDRYYELGDGRLSQFPREWHDALGGSADVAAYLRFVEEEAPGFVSETHRSGAGSGIPEDTLVFLLETVGRVNQETAHEAIAEARDEGVVVEDVDQHPQTGVYLAADHEGRRDGALEQDG